MTSHRTRSRMVDRLQQQGISDSKVLEAMRAVPRHIFVDEALASRSYEDTALPIGYNQTISQPYIVAKMTELLLEHEQLTKVLEIGTGCGYQTAILSQLVDKVYSVERISALLKKAKDNLWDLNFKKVKFQHNDGGCGWPEYSSYDGILVAAAPDKVPDVLLQQLSIGGVMIIPVGQKNKQKLHKITRTLEGFDDKVLDPVSFVPFLTGKS
ncbi:MAG: protein-L-isoaspartate(D-aspartate) O-methyltransferase [Methylococcales bacterium]|nr:protein-L-isoaspartate(D-aspartate) O-methyltransferase [Methylococcales bacterium]